MTIVGTDKNTVTKTAETLDCGPHSYILQAYPSMLAEHWRPGIHPAARLSFAGPAMAQMLQDTLSPFYGRLRRTRACTGYSPDKLLSKGTPLDAVTLATELENSQQRIAQLEDEVARFRVEKQCNGSDKTLGNASWQESGTLMPTADDVKGMNFLSLLGIDPSTGNGVFVRAVGFVAAIGIMYCCARLARRPPNTTTFHAVVENLMPYKKPSYIP